MDLLKKQYTVTRKRREEQTMSNNMIWAYFMHLSGHMWDDENTPSRGWYLPAGTPPIGLYEKDKNYTEYNYTDIPLWDEMMKFLAERQYNMVVIDIGDGIKYESHPEISAPDAWDKDLLKKKLDEMRALGLEPIPKLNFSTCHHRWLKDYSKMVSSPIYYQVCSDLIKEVVELFDYPRLMHLGLDEETPSVMKFRGMCVVRGEKLWWHDAFFFFSEVEKYGVRPWVWSDYYWEHPDLFKKNMPKSVLQSNWFYGRFQDYAPSEKKYTHIKTYEELDELGYEQVPTCSTWANAMNSYQTVAHGKAVLKPELLKGFMTAAWSYHHFKDAEYTLKNDAHRLYIARRELYPETLK